MSCIAESGAKVTIVDHGAWDKHYVISVTDGPHAGCRGAVLNLNVKHSPPSWRASRHRTTPAVPRLPKGKMLAAMCLALGLVGCRAPVADRSAAVEQSGTGKTLAIVGARIYISPTEAPITDGAGGHDRRHHQRRRVVGATRSRCPRKPPCSTGEGSR